MQGGQIDYNVGVMRERIMPEQLQADNTIDALTSSKICYLLTIMSFNVKVNLMDDFSVVERWDVFWEKYAISAIISLKQQ